MRRILLSTVLIPLLLCGCLKVQNRSGTLSIGEKTESGTIGKQVLIRAMPSPGNIRDAQHGKETWFAYGAMLGANGTKANGVATAHFLEDGTYVLGIQLNILKPKDGTYYEAWLFGEGQEQISVGHMLQGQKDVRQTLDYRGSRDLRPYLKIAITRQKDDGDPSPGELVAEGVLRVTKR